MSRITGKDTKPEILIRKYLFSQGFRYRKNVRSLTGSPDIVLPKYQTVIFVHGCFWHGHDCKAARLPSTRIEYWTAKINANTARDTRNIKFLKKAGYKVIIIWECQIKTKAAREKTFARLVRTLRSRLPS